MIKIGVSRKSAVMGMIAAVCCSFVGAAGAADGTQNGVFNPSREITVLSRESGSGTRGAFVELTGIEKKNDAGKKVDWTTPEALITNSTAVMMTSVSGDAYAIGYISLGFLNDSVKALKIDGVMPAVAEIQKGAYPVVRPFLVVTNNTKSLSSDAADFLAFIMSKEGQKVVAANGFIPLDAAESYTPSKVSGAKIVAAGSSSVTPLMEKLKEAYVVRRSDAVIEIQMSDSTTGVTSAQNGICDLGMASRNLKKAESESGLTGTVIARDGIAIVVNKSNPVEGISKDMVRRIFTGEVTSWDMIRE